MSVTKIIWKPIFGTYANSTDPDQGLHYEYAYIKSYEDKKTTIKVKTFNRNPLNQKWVLSTDKDEPVRKSKTVNVHGLSPTERMSHIDCFRTI